MWIEEVKLKNGKTKYKYCERYKDPITGKNKKISLMYSDNKKGTQKEAMFALQRKIDAALHRWRGDDKTFESALNEYISSISPYRKETTQCVYKYISAKLIDMLPKNILLSALTTAIAQRVIDNISTERSHNYAAQVKSLFIRTFKYAKKMGYIDDIAFIQDIELKRKVKTLKEVEKERNKFLSKKDLLRVLGEIKEKNIEVALLCEFQALTGLRFGEMVALQYHEYDREKKKISVNSTLSRAKKERTTPKNIYSIRDVSLNSRAVEIIEQFIATNKFKKEQLRHFNDNNFIFVNSKGVPFDTIYVDLLLKRIKTKGVSTHIFRHTHISLLAEKMIPLKAIMQRVGHNNPQTTLKIYTHVTDNMKKEVDAAIENII